MNTVIRTLREHITSGNVCFVFPSQIAASLWARKTCTLSLARSVALKRFLAWDRFKEEVIREKETKRSPVSSVMRKLFIHALIRKNAETPFLKSLVPVEHARGGAVFVPFIARILPSLSLWEKLVKNSGIKTSEDEDYELLKKEYGAFLERHALFEPSWEEAKIRETSTRYVVFFPELIEDFAEYESLLLPPRFTLIKAETGPALVQEGRPLLFYQSAREEIRSAAMELQRFHEEEGIPYGDMAVSVPELEEMEPHLLLEFSLRHIPVTRRAGKMLGETGAGRLFSLMNECAASRFSFNSLKALILNDHIPWKDREKNKVLVSFGIKYNCVSSYVQDGKTMDIWEEAFKEAYNDGGKEQRSELRPFYSDLKKSVLALAGARDFIELRKFYFAFRRNLLDMETISNDDDAVLSRCIEELSALIELEEKFDEPALIPASPFGFFISHLGETIYVKKEKETGVNIYPWRAAAASPFACHFVLNASQSAATVLYQPMKFLRQDKRKALGIEDRDATAAFFSLYDTGDDEGFKSRTRISASAQTFSGWAIAHSFFAQGKTEKVSSLESNAGPHDPYRDERRFWRELQNTGRVPDAAIPGQVELKKIFPRQKDSFNLWKDTLAQKINTFSFLASPVPEDSAVSGAGPVRELLHKAVSGKDGLITVTPTRDLNVYYSCPLSWLLSRIFLTDEFSLEAALLDDTSLGQLYHKILEELFAKIRDEDGSFNSRRLDIYRRWTLEITKAAIKEHRAFRGPLAVPLVSPQAAGMAKKIAGVLDLEADFFDGYAVAELELRVSFRTGELLIEGDIDRVSVSPEGEPVIVDYKTSYLPGQTDINDLDEVSLSEFQMPTYIKLYEEKKHVNVQGAHFYSINGRKIKTVMGEKTGRQRDRPPSREDYTPFLEAAEKQIEEFAQKVKALDFTPREIRIRDCIDCKYKTVCRSAYFLNAGTRKEED